MFGSHNTYGEYNHSYGNAPYYPPPSNDPFWGNKQQNRMNHRNHDPVHDHVLASDSLYSPYSQQALDGPINHIESGISGLSLNQSKQNDDFGSSSFAGLRKTTWASIASQPAKSQPKSLKSKMAASGLTGSTSKHLPPTVTMDAMSWESKNGSMSNAPSGGKSLPPPAVIANSSVPPPPLPPMTQSSASSIEDLPSPVIQAQPQHSPPQRPAAAAAAAAANQVNKGGQENFWASNGNSSSSGSLSTSASSPRPTQAPINLSGNSVSKVNNNSSNSNYNYNNNSSRGYSSEINENYNPNKYANQRNNNYSKPIDNHQPYVNAKSAVHSSARDIPKSPTTEEEDDDSASHPVVEKLYVENDYNPKEFDLSPRNARFFIIKSYSEDDVHRSIKYSIWCSTEHGNKRLDSAFRQQEDKGPIYLLYSVNRSGHFCGVAQMMSHVDYNASSGVWAQDKWKGQFQVKWIYVKDVPNDELRHITLENNENKPVTNSRDTQEVPYEKGKKVLNIIHNFEHRTSIFDDFLHYEKKQEEEGVGVGRSKSDIAASPPPPSNYSKMSNSQFNSGMPPRDNQPYRGNNANFNKNRSYPDSRDSRDGRNDYDYRNEYRNDPRSDYRPERNDYRNERMERSSDYGRDHRERNADHRNEYRESHIRDNREYRDYRDPPQFGRDQQYRDFQPPPSREYTRERNEYRPPDRDHRDFRDRERPEQRDRNQQHERQQSWRN